MKIWFTPRADKMPQINLMAENANEQSTLAGFKAQLDRLRVEAVGEGVVGHLGDTCKIEYGEKGSINKMTIPLIVGLVEMVPPTAFPPEREDRTQPRFITRRIPGGRRIT